MNVSGCDGSIIRKRPECFERLNGLEPQTQEPFISVSRRDASSGDTGARRKLCGRRKPDNGRLGDFSCSSQLT